jgi:outer membrane lipoprotein-sorting protein
MINAALALIALAPVATSDPGIEDIVQKGFKDVSFVSKVLKADQGELRKINKSFGDSYRFSSLTAYLKEPLKMRLESKIDDTQIVYIVNGFQRIVRVPRSNFTSKEDLKDSPGKIQTPLDMGIITQSVMDQLFDAAFVRTDRATGDYVFDLTYKKPRFDDTSRFRVWVDPQKKYTTKRESYSQKGKLRATFLYENPVTDNGATFPTKVTVKNADDKVAGITSQSSVKLNTGLSDSMFVIK